MKNKINTLIFLVLPAFVWLVSCQKLNENYAADVKLEIQTSMMNVKKAYEDFPKTLDSEKLLRYFTSDFSGVKDGESLTLKDVDRSFDYMAEQIKRNEIGGVSFKVSELNIHPISVNLGWMTYQEERKFADMGKSQVRLNNMKGKCTALVRKEKEVWLIFHEHCSTEKL
ncbi:MAG: nuclear transport factor 2 family protein [Nitrospirales bacterium]